MSNSTGCIGCGSKSSSVDVEDIKRRVEETSKTMEGLSRHMKSINSDINSFSQIKEQLQQMNDFLESGQMESMMQRMVEVTNQSKQKYNESMAKTKVPVAWMYIDDNGEQQISVSKPEGVTSSPLYN